MRMKVSNYIAGQLVAHGISQVFTVTGGGAMHLNDALGHQEGLHCLYQHHEQACAMAAESYARIHNKIGLLCVTTGPGGTNAITGVVGGWLDSIPMLVLSGQVRYDTTARWSGTGIRAMGDQEFDIVKAIGCMTKYSEMVIDPMRIRYCLEKALYLAYSGRPGPCWLDIPLNVQGAYVETDELEGFDVEAYEREQAEIEESRRKPGKYRWVMKQDDMREAMLALEKAKGRYRMYTIAAYVMCVFALIPAVDFIRTRGVFSMIAAFAAAGLGIWIKGITSRAARGAMKQMNPRGIKFSIEAKKHGLQVSDMVNKASLMPYSFFKAAYETEDYLSLVTVKNSALHIKRDEGSASYRALREKLQQELGEHFVSKKIQKNK